MLSKNIVQGLVVGIGAVAAVLAVSTSTAGDASAKPRQACSYFKSCEVPPELEGTLDVGPSVEDVTGEQPWGCGPGEVGQGGKPTCIDY